MIEATEIIEEKATEEKPYTLRKLCADDIFPLCTVLTKIGLKEIKGCFNVDTFKKLVGDAEEGIENDIEKIGFDIAMDVVSVVIANMESCKDSLYQFLSGLSGMTKGELAALDIDVFIGMIVDVIKKDEFRNFFKVASKFVK